MFYHARRVPRPIYCHVCSSTNIALTTTKRAHRQVHKGEWPLIYICYDCDASVHCHVESSDPLGFMATKRTRIARQRAHEIFDKAWRKAQMSRDFAYRWLARSMNVPLHRCHIGIFNEYECEAVIALCQKGIKQ